MAKLIVQRRSRRIFPWYVTEGLTGSWSLILSIVAHIVRPGETLASHGHESRVGGKGANQAVAVARAGGRVQFYGAVGQDGGWIRERMSGYGVGGEIDVVDVSASHFLVCCGVLIGLRVGANGKGDYTG